MEDGKEVGKYIIKSKENQVRITTEYDLEKRDLFVNLENFGSVQFHLERSDDQQADYLPKD